MTRRSLRPQLNQIRAWVRQGRTDAWIAHQLEVTVQQIAAFKRENQLVPDEQGADGNGAGDEIDLRAADDALIAAELEKAEAERAAKAEREEAERKAAEREAAERKAAKAAADDDEDEGDDEDDEDKPRGRRRGRRGSRGRSKRGTSVLEGTFDHGEEGYGLWLDPAVEDSPVYAEHWAGHRSVEITVEPDQIVIRRVESDGDDDD